MRGLIVGVAVGVLGAMLTDVWSLVPFLGLAGFVADVGGEYATHLLHNLRGQDCEWRSEISWSDHFRLTAIGLAQRNPGLPFNPRGLCLHITSPSGKTVIREGDQNFCTLPNMLPEVPVEPGQYEVAWFTKTREGKYLPIVRDRFALDSNGRLVGDQA